MIESLVMAAGRPIINLTGFIFGRLTVIAFHGTNKFHNAVWLCSCSCGTKITARAKDLKYGSVKSCGCLGPEVSIKRLTTHGHTSFGVHTPEYKAYAAAKKRCVNPRAINWEYYGGRGVEFRFKSFQDFYAALGDKPTPKHSVDRIDTNGNYEFGNVKWSTASEQMRNRRKYKHRHISTP